MKHREKLFELLRDCVETAQESFAVEEMIRKVEGTMPPIEIIDENRQECYGFKFYKNHHGNWVGSISLHRFIWTYFNGEIPKGYEIHHCDFNHENNDISNLKLITREEHIAIHARHKKDNCFQKNLKLTCAVCGKKFETVNRGNNTYCSAKCRRKANHEQDKVERVCLVCGKVFLADKYQNAKYCSKKCVGKAQEKQELRICPTCGKDFSIRMDSNQKYCSKKCAGKSRRNREIRNCLKCGKEFEAVINSNRKFCSRECFYEHRRRHTD